MSSVTMVDDNAFRIAFDAQYAGGTYTLVVGPNIEDTGGRLMNQDGDETNGEASDDTFTATFQLIEGGPRVVSIDPAGPVVGSFSQVTVRFDRAIASGTFAPVDVSLRGPDGELVDVDEVTAVSGVEFTISLVDAQSDLGKYTLVVGPNIEDTAGRSMNQDEDEVSGEAEGDTYTTTIQVVDYGPTVVEATPTVDSSGSLTGFAVRFDRSINPSTFAVEDMSLSGPAGSVTITGVSGTGDEFTIAFEAVAGAGTYTLVIGPNIQDTAARLMNQDGDGTNGETGEDAFSLPFTLAQRSLEVTEDGVLIVPGASGLLVAESVDRRGQWTAALGDVLPSHGQLAVITFDASGYPIAGAAIDVAGAAIPAGAFVYTPAADYFGQDQFTYVLTDAEGAVVEVGVVTITVTAVNDYAPDIEELSNTTATAGSTLVFYFDVADADLSEQDDLPGSLTLTVDPGPHSYLFALQNQPLVTWDVNEEAFQFFWAVPSEIHGDFVFTVRATDDGTPALGDLETFSVSVGADNDVPTLISIGGQTTYAFATNEGVELSLGVVTTCPGYSPDPAPAGLFEYRLGPDAPRGAAISSAGVFTWTPAEDQDGVHPITIEVIHPGHPPMMISQTITVTVNEVNNAPGVPTVALEHNTGTSEPVEATGDPTVVGYVTNDGPFDDVTVEVYWFRDDDYDGDEEGGEFEDLFGNEVTTDQDGVPNVVSTLAAVDSDGYYRAVPPVLFVNQTIYVMLRAKEWDPSATLTGNWSGDWEDSETWFTIIYHPDADDTPEITSLDLANNTVTGVAPEEDTTHDPAITGQVTHADGPVEGLRVEFELDNSGTWGFLGFTETDADGQFYFVPDVEAPATLHIRARVVQEAFLQLLKSDWEDIQYSLVTGPPPAPVGLTLSGLALEHDSGVSGTDHVTNDPTVHGYVVRGEDPIGGAIVQFDHDGDEQPDGQVIAEDNGYFVYTPFGLPVGTEVTLYVRALDAEGTIDFDTDWAEGIDVELDYSENNVPYVDALSFSLQHDTGVSQTDGRTADPTVTGTLEDDGPRQGLRVEFDLDGDDMADGFALADENGGFSFTPTGLTQGMVSIRARAAEWDPHLDLNNPPLAEEWGSSSLSFFYDPDDVSVPTITYYALETDSGGEGEDEDGQTNDPTVTGTVSMVGPVAGIPVMISYFDQGKWVRLGVASTDEAGNFAYSPPRGRLADGQTVSMRAEVLHWDTTGQPQVTSVEYLSFTLSSVENVPASIDGTPTFTTARQENTPGPWISGAVTNDGSKEGLTVQLGVNGTQWTTLAETTTDADGDFTFALNDITPGLYGELYVRVGETTYFDSEPQFSSPASVSVETTEETDLAVPSLQLKWFRMDGGTAVAFDPTLVGEVDFDGDSVDWIVQFDCDGDESPDGWTTLDGLGQFEYRPEGLGSSGTATICARLVGSSDTTHWIHGAWSDDITFTLEESVVELEGVRLVYDTGTAGVLDGVTCDPTIAGRVVESTPGLNTLGGMRVTLAVSYDGEHWTEDGWTVTDADGRFTYVPVGLREGGFLVSATVAWDDPIVDDELGDTWFDALAITLQAPPSAPTVSITGGGSTSNPTFTGTISNPGQYGEVVVEFAHYVAGETPDDAIDGTAVCDQAGDFVYTAMGLPFSAINVVARAKVWNHLTGQYVLGEFNSATPITLTANTYLSMSSVATEESSPTISGEVEVSGAQGAPKITPLFVEIDHDNDGVPDGSAEIAVTLEEDSLDPLGFSEKYTFEYLPEDLPAWNSTVKVRPVGWNEDDDEYIVGNWSTGTTFDYNSSAPTVATLLVVDPDDADVAEKPNSTTVGPVSFVGLIDTTRGGAVTVEFDYDSSEDPETLYGVPDASVLAAGDGTFTFVAADLEPRIVSLRARAVEMDPATGLMIRGAWTETPLTFTLIAPTLEVGGLALANDTGESDEDHVTTDPTIEGVVTSVIGEVEEVEAGCYVVIDLDGDEVADDLVMTDATGAFSYRPASLPAGVTQTLHFRAVGSDFDRQAQPGDWTPFTLTYVAVAAPVVETIELRTDTGRDDADRITSDPTLVGTIAYDAAIGGATVEFDLDGDGLADAATTVVEDTIAGQGEFLYTPDVSWGKSTVRVRGVLHTDAETVEGDWTEFTFTLAPDNRPTVGRLIVKDEDTDTGTMTGRAFLDGHGAPLVVEFDHDGDGVAEASVETDGDGWFRYTPTELADNPSGNVTIFVRAILGDATLADDSQVPWKSFSFDYTPEAISAVAPTFDTLGLLHDHDSDRIVADPTIQLELSRDGDDPPDGIDDGPISGLWIDVQVLRWLGAQQQGDWIAAGSVVTDAAGAATVLPMDCSDEDAPAVLPTGEYVGETFTLYTYDVRARVREWDPATGDYHVYDWQAMTAGDLQIDPSENVAATVTCEVNPSTGALVGSVTNPDGPVGGLEVRFDQKQDATTDGIAITRPDGTFTYAPVRAGMGLSAFTIDVQAVETDYATQQALVGPATPVGYTPLEPVAPVIATANLQLLADTGSSQIDKNTADPTVVGWVTYPEDPDDQLAAMAGIGWGLQGMTVTIEAYVDSVLVSTGTTTTGPGGRFVYCPQDLVPDLQGTEVTVYAQAEVLDTANEVTLTSGWTMLEFHLFPSDFDPLNPETYPNGNQTAQIAVDSGPPEQVLFSLVEDTGNPDTSTSNPTVQGTITNDGPLAGITVEIGLYQGPGPEDYEILGTATTNAEGKFVFTPHGLPVGQELTLGARPVEINPMGPNLEGNWQDVTFTLVGEETAWIDSMGLTEEADVNGHYPDPTLTGTVDDDDDRFAGLLVEFDVDGDGVADGATMTDATGGFTYKPLGLPKLQEVTVRARVREWDYATGTYTDPNWAQLGEEGYITFTLSADVPGQPQDDEHVEESLDYLSMADAMMKEVVFGAIIATEDISLGDESGSIDVGAGTVAAYYRGGSEYLAGADPVDCGNAPVALSTTLPSIRNDEGSPGDLITGTVTVQREGASPVNGEYAGCSQIDVVEGEGTTYVVTIDVHYEISFDPYTTTTIETYTENGVTTTTIITETVNTSSYSFTYHATLTYDTAGGDHIISGSSDVTETAEFSASVVATTTASGVSLGAMVQSSSSARGAVSYNYELSDHGAYDWSEVLGTSSSHHEFLYSEGSDVDVVFNGGSASSYMGEGASFSISGDTSGFLDYGASVVILPGHGEYDIAYGGAGQATSYSLTVTDCLRDSHSRYDAVYSASGTYDSKSKSGSEFGAISLSGHESAGSSFGDVVGYGISADDDSLDAHFDSFFDYYEDYDVNNSASVLGDYDLCWNTGGEQVTASGLYGASSTVSASGMISFDASTYSESFFLDLTDPEAEPVLTTTFSANVLFQEGGSISADASESFAYRLSDKYGKVSGSTDGSASFAASYSSDVRGTVSDALGVSQIDLMIQDTVSVESHANGAQGSSETYSDGDYSERFGYGARGESHAGGTLTRNYSVMTHGDAFHVGGNQNVSVWGSFASSGGGSGSFVDKTGQPSGNNQGTSGSFSVQTSASGGFASTDETWFDVSQDGFSLTGSSTETSFGNYNARYNVAGGSASTTTSNAGDADVTSTSCYAFTAGASVSAGSSSTTTIEQYHITDSSTWMIGSFNDSGYSQYSATSSYQGSASRSATKDKGTDDEVTASVSQQYHGEYDEFAFSNSSDEGDFSATDDDVDISNGRYNATNISRSNSFRETSTDNKKTTQSEEPEGDPVTRTLSTERSSWLDYTYANANADVSYSVSDDETTASGPFQSLQISRSTQTNETTSNPEPEETATGKTKRQSSAGGTSANWTISAIDAGVGVVDGEWCLTGAFSGTTGAFQSSHSQSSTVWQGSGDDPPVSNQSSRKNAQSGSTATVEGTVAGPGGRDRTTTGQSSESASQAFEWTHEDSQSGDSKSNKDVAIIAWAHAWSKLGEPSPDEAEAGAVLGGSFGAFSLSTTVTTGGGADAFSSHEGTSTTTLRSDEQGDQTVQADGQTLRAGTRTESTTTTSTGSGESSYATTLTDGYESTTSNWRSYSKEVHSRTTDLAGLDGTATHAREEDSQSHATTQSARSVDLAGNSSTARRFS
ncbi:MAG: hypothetical protein JW809_19215, partial [Pirellulales bacterium]|nr:hypothetical protein [Pirellulales bacterium]